MAIHCPYCRHGLVPKDLRPGVFTTKCPKCTKKFILTVPEEPGAAPVVTAIRSEREAETVVGTSAGAAETMAATGVDEGQATGAWTGGPPPRTAAPTLPGGGEAATTLPTGAEMATGAWESAPGPGPTRAAPTSGAVEATAAQGFQLATGAAGPVLTNEPDPAAAPTTLGGYQVLKELGHGGMGAVYLARQLSLDRNVALKVMKPEWASNPTFVSRFTREAYAAAQLVHHNVVQIYDFGQDRGTSYFSMEFVQGQTLSHLLRSHKKLDPEVAVGYVLQAARGLKYAHDQSMIHRDIKPDNLLLNDQGVVKVADLGLVKTPAAAEAEVALEKDTGVVAHPGTFALASSGQITLANVAMGTPAYMAPEQSKDAAGVDARADIYSLGCTLYDLVTGRPPFEGKTAYELITKHQTEPITPPDLIVSRVPKALSEIILKMVAKRPEDRYANLGEVIRALEEFLGISTGGPFTPREEHANILAESIEAFRNAPTAKLRPKVLMGAAAAWALIVVLSALAGQPILAGGFVGLGLMAAVAYFVVSGVTEKTHLFLKTRELAFGSSPGDWLLVAAGLILVFAALVVTKLVWAWVAFGIVAVMMAVGFHVAIDRNLEAERRGAIEKTEAMLKSMRLHGLDESMVRQFVSKYSGEHWEEFFETLFGYEALLDARDRWGRGERGKPRPKYAAWRDPIVRWIDAKQAARREAKEKKLLQKIEEKSLEAQGVNLVVARRKAQRAAEAMVTMASEIKEAARVPAAIRTSGPSIGQALREAAHKPEEVLVEREKGLYGPRSEGRFSAVLGPKPRFLVGAALLAAFLFWLHQNNRLDEKNLRQAVESAKQVGTQVSTVVTKAAASKDLSALKQGLPTNAKVEIEGSRPLKLPFLPRGIAAKLFNSLNPGVAGLILLVSSFFRGTKMSLFAIPAAAIAFLGPMLGSPALPSMLAGVGLAIVGLFFGRSR